MFTIGRKKLFSLFLHAIQLLRRLEDSYCGLMIPPRRSTAQRRCLDWLHANSTVALTAAIIHPGLSELYEILSINKVNNEEASLHNRRNDDPWTSPVQDKQTWNPNWIFTHWSVELQNRKCKSKIHFSLENKLSLLDRLLNFNFNDCTSETNMVFI